MVCKIGTMAANAFNYVTDKQHWHAAAGTAGGCVAKVTSGAATVVSAVAAGNAINTVCATGVNVEALLNRAVEIVSTSADFFGDNAGYYTGSECVDTGVTAATYAAAAYATWKVAAGAMNVARHLAKQAHHKPIEKAE